MSKSIFKLKYLLFSFIVVIFFFFCVEIGLRILDAGFHVLAKSIDQEKIIKENKLWQNELFSRFSGVQERDPLLLWKFRPNVHKSIFQTNSEGLLGPEISSSKPANTYRILLLGDSAPVGLGLYKREEAFGEQLVDILNQRKPDKHYELINAAVSGYTSLQGLTYLKNYGLRYSPDLILVYFGNNDVSKNGYISDKELMNRNPQLVGFLGTLNRLATYRLLKEFILPIKASLENKLKKDEKRQVVVRVSPEEYYQNIEEMIKLAKANNIKIILVNVPVSLEWPAGLQFKVFANLRTEKGELVMADETQKILKNKFSYCIDWAHFAKVYDKIDPYSLTVFKSAYEDQGNVDSSKVFFERGLISQSYGSKFGPQNLLYLNNLGVIYWREGNYTVAEDLFRKAIATDSTYPLFHYNLGVTLKNEGKPMESEKELEKAKELDFQSLRIKNAYREKLKELSIKYDVPLVDAVSAFNQRGNESLFIDHCHPTREGHRIIAEEIYKTMEYGVH
jgi:lysophospholipase L1-like esterase